MIPFIHTTHYVQEWESRFTLGLNAAKTNDYIRKCFKQKLFEIKFLTKNLVDTDLSPPRGELGGGAQRLLCLKYYDVLKEESRFTLGLNAAKNTDIKKMLQIKLVWNQNSYKKVGGAYI